ncbi:MAG: flavin reductase family protein [Pyrinomonadaceae bacterium]
MPVSPNEFRSALSRFASGITVVTTKDDSGKFYGITVSAFCSVSLEPPLVLICIEKLSGSHSALLESSRFTVNILAAGDEGLSEHFASILDEKFEGIAYEVDDHGLPFLPSSIARLECSVFRTLDGGDHSVFLGLVEGVSVHDAETDPLLYFQGGYREIAK